MRLAVVDNRGQVIIDWGSTELAREALAGALAAHASGQLLTPGEKRRLRRSRPTLVDEAALAAVIDEALVELLKQTI